MSNRFHFFAPSPNASGTGVSSSDVPRSRSSNSTIRPGGASPNTECSTATVQTNDKRYRIESTRRILPSSPIVNPKIYDLISLAGSIEPMSKAMNGNRAHHAGHVADTVYRYPSTIIGRGATFTAMKVRVPCECITSGHVVVKTPRITSKVEDVGLGLRKRLKHMLFEIRVLRHEPLMFHDNVIQLLGITWEDDQYDLKTKWPGLILEYADAGNLADVTLRDDISHAMRLKLCYDVAKGLSALHNCGIIHSDVKSENILVCTDAKSGFVAKVADFGFSLAEAGDGARLPGGTVPWNAPEWLEWIPTDQLPKTDAYSFGLLVWRVMTKTKNPFQEKTANPAPSTNGSTEIDALKSSDTRMLHTISSLLRRTMGQAPECSPSLEVIQCTVRKDPLSRNLPQAIEILERAMPRELLIPSTTKEDLDMGEMCRDIWKYTLENMPDLLKSPAAIRRMCGMLTGETNISSKELGDLEREHGGQRIDEIRVLLPTASDKLSSHLNPDLVALEFSKFSANHIRLLHPDVQEMVYQSLVQSCEAGSGDAGLYLSIFHTNVLFDSQKACGYIYRAANLGSSSATYLCYRVHKAHGIPLPVPTADIDGWFHQGICWGSQVAYQDALEANRSLAATATLILKQQGSCYGDTPFREAAVAGPFDCLHDDFATVMTKVRAMNKHVDDIVIVGDNGDKLLHWAAAMHGSPFQRDKGLLKSLITEGKASPNVRNAKGETPLLAAMKAGNGPAVGELLKLGADATIKSHSGQVPLHWIWALPEYSSSSVSPQHNEEAMRLLCLVLGGGSSEVLNSVADAVSGRVNGFKELEHSTRLQSYILSDLPAGTPLHWAVQRRCIPVIKALLAAGASPNACAYGADTEGGSGHGYALSPFQLAAAMHDDDILELFLQKSPTLLRDSRPCAMAMAIDGNVSEGYANGTFERMVRHGPQYQARAQRTMQLFWDQGYRELGYGFGSDRRNITPLLLAVQSGQKDVVEALLASPFKRDLEKRGNEGNNTPLQESIKRRCDDVYFLLRRHGADVGSTWETLTGGHTNLALVAAVGHGRLDVAQDLINAGISVRSRRSGEMSPFALAVNGGQFALAKLLLSNGASPNEVQDSRIGMLSLNPMGFPTTVLGCLVNCCSKSKLLPLSWLLDEHTAGRLPEPLNTTVCPTMGFNVFHVLALTGEDGRDDASVMSAFSKLRAAFPNPTLLQGGNRVSQLKNFSHMQISPLFLAVETSNPELVQSMLDAGADPSQEVEGGKSVADYAELWSQDFERNVRNKTLPEGLKTVDPSEVQRMLKRRQDVSAHLSLALLVNRMSRFSDNLQVYRSR